MISDEEVQRMSNAELDACFLPSDPFAVHLTQDLDLQLDILDFVFGCLEVNNLDSDGQSRLLFVAFVHFAE